MKRIARKENESIKPVPFKKLSRGDVFSMEDPAETDYTDILIKIDSIRVPMTTAAPARRARSTSSIAPAGETASQRVVANAIVLSDDDNNGGRVAVIGDEDKVFFLPQAAIDHGKIGVPDKSGDDEDEDEEG